MKPVFQSAVRPLSLMCLLAWPAAAQVSPGENVGNAIRKGDLAAVKTAVEADPKLLKSTSRGGSLLYSAIQSGKADIVAYLLEKGADPNGENRETVPLVTAMSSGYNENWRPIAELLVAKGAKVNAADAEGQTPLLRVLNSGGGSSQKDKITWLIERGADLNARGRGGRNALETAIYSGSSEMVTLLVDKADVKRADENGNTPLFAAVSRSNSGFVRQLLDKGADLNAQNALGETALHLAAQNPGPILKTLVDAGARTDLKNNRGDLPIHIALRRRDEAAASPGRYYDSDFESRPQASDAATPRGALIAPLTDKSDPNVRDQFGLSPLLLAIVARDQESRDLLIERAPKMDATTQLFDAAAQGDLEKAKTLLATKPYLVYFRLPEGSTPLHVSALWGTLGTAQYLVQKGADVNARNSRGETPLHKTLSNASGLFARRAKNMTAFLLEKGADAGALDGNDISPLHRAVKVGDSELVSALLARKINPNTRDKSGQTPLFALMTRESDLALVKKLVEAGARVNIRPQSNTSLLARAVQTRRVELVSLLLESGAEVTSRDSENRGILSLVANGSSDRDGNGAAIAALLLAKGADPNESLYGQPLLSRAIQNDSKDLVRALLATKRVNLQSVSDERQPPLLQAVSNNRLEIARMLLEAGASAGETDAKGRTIAQIAAEKSPEMGAIFTAHAAKTTAK